MDSHRDNSYYTTSQYGDATADPNFLPSNVEEEPSYTSNADDIHRSSGPPYGGPWSSNAPATETYSNVHANEFTGAVEDPRISLNSAQRGRDSEHNFFYGGDPPSTQSRQPMRAVHTTAGTSAGQPAQLQSHFNPQWPMGRAPFQPISYSMAESGPGVSIWHLFLRCCIF
jgi:hypothetical protein